MEGIIAAVPTPVDEGGRPLRTLFTEHCRWALSNGCDGLNVLGSTGEASSFDTETRREVMRWAAEDLGTGRLMVGTATPSLAETVALTEHADDLGYGVALVLPPYYYKPLTDRGLVRWYMALHEALGDRKIAIYFYNYPQMTGLVIPPAVIEELRAAAPERFAGIKDSSGDLDYCRDLAKLHGFAVFPSSETALTVADEAGFAGCISASVNHSAPLVARYWRENRSEALAERIAERRKAIGAQPLIPSVKYLVSRRTGESAWTNTLPPFADLTKDEQGSLDALPQKETAPVA